MEKDNSVDSIKKNSSLSKNQIPLNVRQSDAHITYNINNYELNVLGFWVNSQLSVVFKLHWAGFSPTSSYGIPLAGRSNCNKGDPVLFVSWVK